MREQRQGLVRILSCQRSLWLKWACTKDLSPFLFALVVDVVNKFVREGALSELLYADDLVLMSETIERLRGKFSKWKEAFESKALKVNLEKAKVMLSSGFTQVNLSKNKDDP